MQMYKCKLYYIIFKPDTKRILLTINILEKPVLTTRLHYKVKCRFVILFT